MDGSIQRLSNWCLVPIAFILAGIVLFSGQCTCDTYWSKYDNKKSLTGFNLPHTHLTNWTKLQLMPALHVHTVELHMLEWANADQNKNLNKNCTIIIIMYSLCVTWSLHVCQISLIIRESPRYSTNLLVSRMCHQISLLKLTFELFCVLVWNLAHLFPPKFKAFFDSKSVSETFCNCFIRDRGYFSKTNFDGM